MMIKEDQLKEAEKMVDTVNLRTPYARAERGTTHIEDRVPRKIVTAFSLATALFNPALDECFGDLWDGSRHKAPVSRSMPAVMYTKSVHYSQEKNHHSGRETSSSSKATMD